MIGFWMKIFQVEVEKASVSLVAKAHASLLSCFCSEHLVLVPPSGFLPHEYQRMESLEEEPLVSLISPTSRKRLSI